MSEFFDWRGTKKHSKYEPTWYSIWDDGAFGYWTSVYNISTQLSVGAVRVTLLGAVCGAGIPTETNKQTNKH